MEDVNRWLKQEPELNRKQIAESARAEREAVRAENAPSNRHERRRAAKLARV